MPYIPHTANDVEQMLATIGAQSIDELYDEIPSTLRVDQLHGIPNGINEMQATRLATELAKRDHYQLNFIGAGAYEHHIPAAVWDIASRGELLTCYTPYQAEASQGTLQLLYEFQTMIASLAGMEVANASLYDGASALAEAILMAVRCHRQSQSKRILLPGSLHPYYRRTVESLVSHQGIKCLTIDFCPHTGKLDQQQLAQYAGQDITAIVIAQPNFFGVLDDVDTLTQWCETNNSKVIACVNPLSLAVLKEPGQWGTQGADIVCGELQPFGIPLSSGGPYAGFLCCKQTLVRQMPGRIIGRTVDSDGNDGFVLTLQAREQHIRRSKATSNICTNQGLLVTAATLYMSLLGAEGLQRVAQHCHANCQYLAQKVAEIDGVKLLFPNPWFHEVVLQFDQDVAVIIDSLAQQHILAGFNLSTEYPQLPNSLLVCVTETKTSADIDRFVHALQYCLQECSPC